MIRKLPAELIREIAAGEVVTSPVDILKELLENALDAGATRLAVELDDGGLARIAVIDNGLGIPRDQLALAVEAHSTSKLTSLQAIRTLGFRGEGLYAIRMSARLKLTSRPSEQLGGATVIAEGPELTLSEHPAPAGTRAEVTQLFARLPARRAALKPPAPEARQALALLSRYLLHHPALQLRVQLDGQEHWVYAGSTFAEAVKFWWGPVTANRLLVIEGEQVQGLLSRPELTRPRRDRLLLAVNGRPVEWPEALLRALLQAYRELIPGGHYPVGVINLSIPVEEVLVNTSPDKRQVRLLAEAEVVRSLRQSVEALLSRHPLTPALPDFQMAEGVAAAPRSSFPRLHYLGSYQDLYLLAASPGQLWVVDQHAAHERIIFEELQQRYLREPPVALSYPELLQLSAEEEAGYRERCEVLAAAGLGLEPFGGGTWRLRTAPAFLVGHPELLAEVVKGALGRHGWEEAWRRVLARLACLPAIRAGHRLSGAGAQALLDALAQCHTPWACPHGRPTALVLSELELVRKFGRRSLRAVAERSTPRV
jgi:DNA mismatch repair protein MutL